MSTDSVITLILVLILWLMVSVVTEERIHPEVMQEAILLCENNQGLDYIEADVIREGRSFYGDVVCKDGFHKTYSYSSIGEKE